MNSEDTLPTKEENKKEEEIGVIQSGYENIVNYLKTDHMKQKEEEEKGFLTKTKEKIHDVKVKVRDYLDEDLHKKN
jgi:hypothetical protein